MSGGWKLHLTNGKERKYFVERVGPMEVLRAYADNFEKLPFREKMLVYHLTQAAIAGQDISFDQIHKHSLEIRKLLEAIITDPFFPDVGIELANKIEKYYKLFSKHNGMYEADATSRKIIPEFTFGELLMAAKQAVQNGVKIELNEGESLTEKLLRLKPYIFDIDFEPILTNKAPGVDAVETSAVNYYDGVTQREVEEYRKEGWEEHPLNSKIVKENGEIIELVWRAGGYGRPAGMYAGELQEVIKHLEAAIDWAESEYQKETIRLLIRFLQTGEKKDFYNFSIHWVRDNSKVDFILGFVETYLDPLDKKGQFEAVVYYHDPVSSELIKKLNENVLYFEERNPWSEEYKNKNIKPGAVAAVNVITETGFGLIFPAIGINMPNEADLKEKYGSKSISLKNKIEPRAKSDGQLLKEFCYDEEEIQLAEKYESICINAIVALHEILGHASGKVAEGLRGHPADYLLGYYSTLEEARAELVALWHIFDDKLIEIGLMPDKKAGEVAYQRFVRDAFLQLRKVPEAAELQQDHMKARQMIVNYVRENSDAVQVAVRDGKTYLIVADFEKMREMIGKLLAEVMRIKAEGDLEAAKKLVDGYGLKINIAWRNEVVERAKKLDLPRYIHFLMPKLELAIDKNGKPIDVKIVHYPDLLSQLLDLSKPELR